MHAVPAGWSTSAGQLPFVPLHVSSASHAATAPRQTVPAATYASLGQRASVPGQYSSTSHTPVAIRQSVNALA